MNIQSNENQKKEITIKIKQTKTLPSLPILLLLPNNFPTFLHTFLPFEPTLFPKLQVYYADFPYLRYTISPEAINLEDLMRLLVRHGLKMIFFNFIFNNTSFFMEQKQYTVIGNNKQVFKAHLLLLKRNIKKYFLY